MISEASEERWRLDPVASYLTSLNPGCSQLLISSACSSEFAENEFFASQYVEFRTILDGQPTTSRALESGWQELRK